MVERDGRVRAGGRDEGGREMRKESKNVKEGKIISEILHSPTRNIPTRTHVPQTTPTHQCMVII